MPLVAFDFDGTLTEDEMIVELGVETGHGEEITAITERAMDGELSYAQSLRQRVGLLAGASYDEIAVAFDRVALLDGMSALLESLSAAGVPVVILTGGFESGIERVLDRAGVNVDRIVANRLIVDDEGRLTGGVDGPLVDGTKDQALAAVAADLGIERSDTIAVGDGANDIPMLQAAATAIGFRPKESVIRHCDIVVASIPELRATFAELGVIPAVPDRDRDG